MPPALRATAAGLAPVAAIQAQISADLDEIRARMAAIIATTDDAAAIIISNIEQAFADGGAGMPDAVRDRLFSMLSACAFHDLAGQHLARIAELLSAVEAASALASAGLAGMEKGLAERSLQDETRHSRMVSGPAFGAHAHRQADIDAHFDEAGQR